MGAFRLVRCFESSGKAQLRN
ncbi:uncharacterized protein G2W53_004643 [Senna tora]|uniref:Uncharacterized protein n=1 Tax=Senna tora TaxID=362788 RepID=A0A834XD96_9FABA|nr:uncharacterized protein G2W53_004643 [Senna tora]